MFIKRISLLAIIVTGLIILSPQISFGAEEFNRDLYFGLRQDSDVMKLQEFLVSEELYSGPITGNFFSLTLKAVKAFQFREGITPAAGYFGPKTRVRANELLNTQVQASDQQAIAETEQNIPQSTTSQIKNNSISNIQSQLEELLKKVASLQEQIKTQQQIIPLNKFEIMSVNVIASTTSANIEWETTRPSESRIYISGPNFFSKMFWSQAGYSERHFINIIDFYPETTYSYQIIAIGGENISNKSGTFTTAQGIKEVLNPYIGSPKSEPINNCKGPAVCP